TALPREAPVPHGTVVIEVVIRTGETSAAWAWEYAHPSRPAKALRELLKETVSALLADGRAAGDLSAECKAPGKDFWVTNKGRSPASLKDPGKPGSVLEVGPGQSIKVDG